MKNNGYSNGSLFEFTNRKRRVRLLRAAVIVALAIAFGPLALPGGMAEAKMIVYPAQGQGPDQQKQDEYECHDWAVGQTGFDPTKEQAPPAQQAKERGGAVRGAAGGALVGLGVGAIAGNAGKGAAIGAGAGVLAGGAKQAGRNQQKAASNQQSQANYNARLQEYNKAKMVCLEGRGYTVK
jgi:hypothetical protein